VLDMSNEVIKQPDATSPALPVKDFFTSFGEDISTRHIRGDLLKYNKGDWIAGDDDKHPLNGQKVVAVMPSLLAGYVRWSDGHPVDHQMGLVCEGHRLPARSSLGDTDPTTWEIGSDDKPKDPWQRCMYLMCVGEDDAIYTYATASTGGFDAVATLCKAYGQRSRMYPDEVPVVLLDSGSYMHRDRGIGKVLIPVLKIVDWTSQGPTLALLDGGDPTNTSAGDAVAQKPAQKKIAVPTKKNAKSRKF
jgi:hypothetical protein